MTPNQLARLALVATLAVAPATVLAADHRVRSEPGFYGNVLFGGGYLNLESNLVAGNSLIDVEDSTIQSLNQSPDSNSDGFPFISGEVNYAFAERWEAFFGGSIEDYVTLDFSTRLGLRTDMDGVGVVGVGLLFSGLPPEVYEDPYLVGSPRVDTDRDSSGLRFDWWRIFGSDFFLRISTREIDVDKERSGTDPALGLTQGEIQRLRRDGDDRAVTLGYRWESGRQLLQPEISFGEDDRDGDAVSADTAAVKLTYSYGVDVWTWVATGQYFTSDYDAANPVFGRRTDSDGYAVSATVFRRLQAGGGNWQAFGSATYADSNSDVDFHDATAYGFNLGVAYFFGNRAATR